MPLAADVAVGGQLDGDLRLRWSGEDVGMRRGSAISIAFQVQTTALPSELRSGRIRLECQKERVQLAPVQMRSGDLTATASGSIEFQRRLQFKLAVRRRSNDDALNVQIAGPWAAPTWRVGGAIQSQAHINVAGPHCSSGGWKGRA